MPSPGTLRAYVIEWDGQIHCVAGVVREGGIGKFFSDNTPELQPYLKSITIMRALVAATDFCRTYRGPVIAVASTVESCFTLPRLGFEHMHGVYYGWFDKWHNYQSQRSCLSPEPIRATRPKS